MASIKEPKLDIDILDSEKSAIAIADGHHNGLEIVSKDWDDNEEKKLKLK